MQLREYLTNERKTTNVLQNQSDSGRVVVKDRSVLVVLKKYIKKPESLKLHFDVTPEDKEIILNGLPLKMWDNLGKLGSGSWDDFSIDIVYPENIKKGETIVSQDPRDFGKKYRLDKGSTLSYNRKTKEMVIAEKNERVSFSSFVGEGRPRIIKFKLKKTKYFWTIKNTEDGSHIRLKQFNINRLKTFLHDVNAYDNKRPLSTGMNFDNAREQLLKSGEIEIYIPANRINYMKTVYNGDKSPYGNPDSYKFDDKNVDTSEYEKAYDY